MSFNKCVKAGQREESEMWLQEFALLALGRGRVKVCLSRQPSRAWCANVN